MSAAIYIMGMFLVFILGGQLGLAGGYLLWGRKPVAEKPVEAATDDEIELARKEREELINSQKAFQSMMGYNADIAYGINREDEFTAGGS